MNKEEKKAIEILQGLCTDDCINNDVVQTVVNLISNQQKEIKKLKDELKECVHIETLQKEGFFNVGFDKAVECIRDKIKEKIERLEVSGSLEDDIAVPYLKELLRYLEDFLRRVNK